MKLSVTYYKLSETREYLELFMQSKMLSNITDQFIEVKLHKILNTSEYQPTLLILKDSNLDFVLNILYRFENLPFPVYEITLKIFYHNYCSF